MTKFVGKFRKDKEYNDDYNYTPKRSRNEHAEIKKLKNRDCEDFLSEIEKTSLPQKSKQY